MNNFFTRLLHHTFPLIIIILAGCGGNSTPPPTYSVGGTLYGLLPGNNVTLTNNGKDTLTLSANGTFAFTTRLPEGASYSITVAGLTPIAQTCTATNGTGSVNAAITTILQVSCEAIVVAAGQVETAAGEVQATSSAGKSRALHQGDPINEGDTLRSGPKATANIQMGDGGMITMRPDTEFKIDNYKFNGQQDGTEKSFFSLFKGGFRSVTGLIGKLHKKNYRINTANAVLGIRGTDHEVYLVLTGSDAAKFSRVGTYDTVYSGATTLTNDKGSIVIEPKQMGYVAAPDQKPKLEPIDTKLFVPEPTAPKPVAPTPSPVAKPVAATPPPLATPPATTLAAAAPVPVATPPVAAPMAVTPPPAVNQTATEETQGPVLVKIPGKGYEIGKYEVTQKEWRDIMDTNPSQFNSCGDSCPVEQVSLDDVHKFLIKINQRTGKHYRLPTEQEWQYACKGGKKLDFCGNSEPDGLGWFAENSSGSTHAVGKKLSNAFGIYDMNGNIAEWVEDELGNSKMSVSQIKDLGKHVILGGSFENSSKDNYKNYRRGIVDSAHKKNIGFRLAISLP